MVVDQRTVGATSMDGPPVAPDGSGARPRYAHSPSRRSGKDRSRTLLLGVVGLVGVVGITMGAFVNFKMMVFNADTAHSAMLWYGVQHDGLSFLSTWYYSPDNWILSVLPLHFLAYGLFGVHPWVPMVIGWLTLPGSILLTRPHRPAARGRAARPVAGRRPRVRRSVRIGTGTPRLPGFP